MDLSSYDQAKTSSNSLSKVINWYLVQFGTNKDNLRLTFGPEITSKSAIMFG